MWTCGAPIRQASGNQAGVELEIRRSIQEPARNRGVALNSAVAQKRPVTPGVFQQLQIAFADQNFFVVVRGFGDDAAEGISKERSTPEFQTLALRAIAAYFAELMTYAVYRGHEDAIRNGVGALDGPPRLVLSFAVLGLFIWMPADSGWIKQNVCPLERGKTRP